MKVLDIIHDANSNLWRSKIRSFLTILAIFVGSFTIILNSAINAGVNDFLDKQVANMGGEGYLEMMPVEAYETALNMIGSGDIQEYTEEQNQTNASVYIKDEQVEKARKIEGMKSFHTFGSASADYIQGEKTDKRYRVTINGAVPGFTVDMSHGRAPNTNDDAPYEIALTEKYAKTLGYDNLEEVVNAKIKLAVPNPYCQEVSVRSECQTIVEATVTGVQAPGILSMGGNRANIPLYNRISEINTQGLPASSKVVLQAVADVDPDKIDDIKAQLEEIGLRALTIDDEIGMFRTFFDAILIVFNIFGAIALVAASIGIINTLFMSVQERTREIGLDKALGMSNAKVFLSFSCEAILLGFWGSLFGIIVSIIAGNVANVVATETFLKDFPTFKLTIFEPLTMLSIALIIMFIAFLAGTLPARKASKKDPIDSLRYE